MFRLFEEYKEKFDKNELSAKGDFDTPELKWSDEEDDVEDATKKGKGGDAETDEDDEPKTKVDYQNKLEKEFNELRKSGASVEQLQSKYSTYKKEYEDKIANAKEERKSLRSELDDIEDMISDNQNKLQRKERYIKELDDEIKEYEDKIKIIKKEFSEAINDYKKRLEDFSL